jgi:hypothetical protein
LYQAAATNAVAAAGDFDGVNFAFFDVAVNAAPIYVGYFGGAVNTQ